MQGICTPFKPKGRMVSRVGQFLEGKYTKTVNDLNRKITSYLQNVDKNKMFYVLALFKLKSKFGFP